VDPPQRRARGTSAGLDIGRIVRAARTLEPDALTMQAVADMLGVDRKALHNHVNDREKLLKLVALDAFSERFSTVHIGEDSNWEDASRAYARGITESVIAAGPLAAHLSPADTRATGMLQATESLLSRLVDGGFNDVTAVRLLALLTNICMGFARDVISASSSGERPRALMLRESLDDGDEHSFPHLRRIVNVDVDTYAVAQLELSVEIFIVGAERFRTE
jgi:TetR/AcrR family tetracycline transcriptional repressor